MRSRVSSPLAGPLQAAVAAQAQAAQSTTDFVKSVGFYPNGTAITVSFKFFTTNATTGAQTQSTLTIPYLTIVPIPFLKVSAACVCVLPLTPESACTPVCRLRR